MLKLTSFYDNTTCYVVPSAISYLHDAGPSGVYIGLPNGSVAVKETPEQIMAMPEMQMMMPSMMVNLDPSWPHPNVIYPWGI